MENSKLQPEDVRYGFGGLTLAMVTSASRSLEMPVPEGFSKNPVSCSWPYRAQENLTERRLECIEQQLEPQGVFVNEEDSFQEEKVPVDLERCYYWKQQTEVQQVEREECYQNQTFQFDFGENWDPEVYLKIFYEETKNVEEEHLQMNTDPIPDLPLALPNTARRRNGRLPPVPATANTCFRCGKRLLNNYSLQRHITKCKKIRISTSSTSSNSDSAGYAETKKKKPQATLTCEVCGQGYSSKHNLTRHQKIERKEKNDLSFPRCINDAVIIHFGTTPNSRSVPDMPIKMSRLFLTTSSNRFKNEFENKLRKEIFLEDISRGNFKKWCAIQNGTMAVDDSNYWMVKESLKSYDMKLAEEKLKEFEQKKKGQEF
ncbi:hypothetical protein CAEBREN_25575 [Caenorhabditis brenneri]|uniref:C2H2-type domain-containing protein n=1 Tax=Caenorhabditis brenneri TaxID=135651 RepID=G0NKS6_CAEBE|nr:hypothetical protein CAEBREN_25575 [Caenorhabditis brenneri]